MVALSIQSKIALQRWAATFNAWQETAHKTLRLFAIRAICSLLILTLGGGVQAMCIAHCHIVTLLTRYILHAQSASNAYFICHTPRSLTTSTPHIAPELPLNIPVRTLFEGALTLTMLTLILQQAHRQIIFTERTIPQYMPLPPTPPPRMHAS